MITKNLSLGLIIALSFMHANATESSVNSASSVMHSDPNQLSCMLEPSRRISISSHVPGVIDTLNVDRGSVVKKGQLLFSLGSDVEDAAVKMAEVRAEFSKRQWQRNDDISLKSLVSKAKHDELKTEKNLAQWNLKESEARLNRRHVRSPIDGLVVRSYVDQGEYINEKPVLELVDLNPLYVEVVLRAETYGHISKGSKMQVRLNDGSVHDVVIDVVDKVIDSASGTYGLRAKLKNTGFEIPAGINCDAMFTEGREVVTNN